ncbi:phage/plasmid primase, P4 family [Streptomyces sp. CA-250714]|uniref:phage/plasmid primase, P4 family n=1 Tax=Streptomyces sp. CA-250714 TaxID=3240060 RepID=UPI003D8B9ECA
MDLAEILDRFERVSEESDGGYLARCPAHGDGAPSLRLWVGDDRKVRLTCRAGCETSNVIASVGLSWSDLFDVTGEVTTVPQARPELVGPGAVVSLKSWLGGMHAGHADYCIDRFGLYPSEARRLGVVAYDRLSSSAGWEYIGSTFAAFSRVVVPLYGFDGVPRGAQGRDISGGCPHRWVGLTNPPGQHWALYGVLRAADPDAPWIVTEGPGDGLTAVAAGFNAVIVRGAALARSPELVRELAEHLNGKRIIAAGDNDEGGLRFNVSLIQGMRHHGETVRELRIPDHGPKTDITRWREAEPDDFAATLSEAVREAMEGREAVKEKADAVQVLADARRVYGRKGDVAPAYALAQWSDGEIKYASGIGFHVWNGSAWEPSAKKVRSRVHTFGAALVDAGRDDDAIPFTDTRLINNLITELCSVDSVHADVDEFDANPDVLSFRNGTVDLRTGELRPHDPADMLTHVLDIDYRPDAECPGWLRYLDEVMPGMPEMPAYLQRLAGYGVTGHTSEQCFAVHFGHGANGKSIFVDALNSIFSAVSKTSSFATFEERASGGIPNDIAALRNARLVFATEGRSGKPMDEATLKSVTGGEKITARFLRKEFFEYKPRFLIMLSSNYKPKFVGQDEGIWRRVKLIPWQRYFEPHEREDRAVMDHRFQVEEAEGIAAWVVRGAMEWYRTGLADPEVIRDATSEYRQTSDALAGFFPGRLVRADGEVMNGADAYNAYTDWAEANNLAQREIWSRIAFYARMEERGIAKGRNAKGITLIGIKDSEAEAAPAGPGIFGGGDA